MGPLTEDELLMMFIINALGDHYPRLQTSVNNMLVNPMTTSADFRARLLQEEQTISTSSSDTAHAAVSTRTTRPVCPNCKRSFVLL
jgi:hypothetical protein